MFALERIRLIKKYLEEHEQVEVNTLSSLLGVSEVTVRRDLEKLEEEGYLTRTHGGALLNAAPEYPLQMPEAVAFSDDVKEIAETAVRMIRDDDIIMLTSGPVNLRLSRKLEDRDNVTVLTNDLGVAVVLAGQPQNKTVLLGGDLNTDAGTLHGPMTMENLQKFYVNHLFFEADGITEQFQLTVSSQEKAALIREAVRISRDRIVLCTADKFPHSSFYRLGGLDLATKIISNPRVSDDFKNMLFMKNIPLFTSTNVFEGRV